MRVLAGFSSCDTDKFLDHLAGGFRSSGLVKKRESVTMWKSLAAVGLVATSMAAPAFAVTLECSIPQSVAGGGYITETYVFHHDPGDSTAVVSDGVILYFFDAPIEARITGDSDRKLVISWEVPMSDRTGQQTRMAYRATYFRQNGQMTVRATPGGGYTNSFEGRGTCRQV
jgi:hypothetical protein